MYNTEFSGPAVRICWRCYNRLFGHKRAKPLNNFEQQFTDICHYCRQVTGAKMWVLEDEIAMVMKRDGINLFDVFLNPCADVDLPSSLLAPGPRACGVKDVKDVVEDV